MTKIRASIIGATGFTGIELLRVLLAHPDVEIAYLVSRQHEDTPLKDVFPRLSHLDQGLRVTNTAHGTVAAESDVVFLCLPHVVSQDVAESFLGQTKLIDMSADFRLRDAETYKKFYNTDHKKPELLGGRFVYGLPEINRAALSGADAVANPGCFALLIQLLLLPFKGHIRHADLMAISGTTGGGRSPRDPVDHPYCAQNMRSYLINTHRHTPEITATLGLDEAQLNYVPTVGPFLRGIFATAFVKSDTPPAVELFKKEPFIRLTDKVELTNVVSTNYCDLSYQEGREGSFIAQGAIDNLLRGAAGTAVQNMNVMFGLPETAGLNFISPVYP